LLKKATLYTLVFSLIVAVRKDAAAFGRLTQNFSTNAKEVAKRKKEAFI
jgi:hypothetical protein